MTSSISIKVIQHSIAKAFSRQDNSPRNKYVMYFYLVTYFLIALLCCSVQLLCITLKKYIAWNKCAFSPQKGWMCQFNVPRLSVHRVYTVLPYCIIHNLCINDYGNYITIILKVSIYPLNPELILNMK